MPKKDYDKWSQRELVDEIASLQKRKKYGLVWVEKTEDVVEQCKKELPVLEEVSTRAITTDDSPTNLVIEGDNYHALSVLNYTHNGKIDFIYIDPPYNTGNNSWKYNNKYIDEDDPFRHSKWISFMYHRLKQAKGLLKRSGILCMTIDNYELHNARHLLEEIFQNKEIITTVIEHNYRGRAKSNFALTHEYALWAVPKGQDVITRQDEISEDIRRNLRRTGQGSRRHQSPTLYYGIEVDKKTLEILSYTEPIPQGQKNPVTANPKTEYVFPIDSNSTERRWYYSGSTMFEEAQKGNVYAKYIDGKLEIHYWKPGKPKRRKSVWTGPEYDSSTYGSELLTEVIGENDFPFPKSLYSVVDCISAATQRKDALILDFFAGSGTTGHAVLELNKRDGGNRRFILCAKNENNITDEILYPRIRNVIQGYAYRGKDKQLLFEKPLTISALRNIDESLSELDKLLVDTRESANYETVSVKVEDNRLRLYGERRINGTKEGLGGNLRYFKTSFVDSELTDKNKILLTAKATQMLCVKEDTYEEVLTTPAYAIFRNSNRYTGIILDHTAIPEFKTAITDLDGKFSVYVFSLGDDTFDEEFEDVAFKVKLSPIPEAILRVYRRIFQ